MCLVAKTNILATKFSKSGIATVCLIVVREKTVTVNVPQYVMTLLCVIKEKSTFISLKDGNDDVGPYLFSSGPFLCILFELLAYMIFFKDVTGQLTSKDLL